MKLNNIRKAPKSTVVGLALIALVALGLYTGVLSDYTFATLVFTTAVTMLPTNWFREKKEPEKE